MDEQELPSHYGSSEPTSANIQTARRLIAMHPRVNALDRASDALLPICQYCAKPFPCADAQWAERIFAAARRAGRSV